MKYSAVYVTVGVALLSVLGTWLLVRSEGTGRQAAPAVASHTEPGQTFEKALTSLKSELATLKREYDRLTYSLRAIEETLNRSLPAITQPGALSDIEEGVGTDAGNSLQRSQEEKTTEALYTLDLQLGKEPDDTTWSPGAEAGIATFVHSESMEGSHVLSADCRSTLCRVELEHEDVSAQDWLVTHFPMEPPFDGEILVHQINNDPLPPRTLVYLARPGHSVLGPTP
jgi:hypothetical protein